MLIAIAFLYGLIYGSFLNVLLARLPVGESITGRSHCPACRRTIAWYDLVPLASYLFLDGRCRSCGNHISLRYPLVELISGLTLGAYAWLHAPGTILFHTYMIFGLLALIALFFFDIFYFILPDVIVLPAAGAALVYDLFQPHIFSYILGVLLVAGFFAILYAGSRGRWIGFGDVKLGLFIGLFCGYPLAVIVATIGIWAGALVGILLLLFAGAHHKTRLPLGAFLSAATIWSILFHIYAQSLIATTLFR